MRLIKSSTMTEMEEQENGMEQKKAGSRGKQLDTESWNIAG